MTDLSGFEALEGKILELAGDSPSLRAEWPSAWLSVRDEVRTIRRQQPHLTPEEFCRLMARKGVVGLEAQRDLGRQMHDLGEILYFQERDELSGLVILDPEWVTELIALVVRSKVVREQNGILRKADLDKLWEGAELEPGVREHLIHLMAWFDLTYSTGHRTDLGIVVEALPYSTPETLKEIDLAPDRPRMEMIFRFPTLQRRLPPGIPTWGIARAHRFSTCKPWRDAAAFEDRDTNSQALILASDTAKEVRLRVTADYPPFFFGRMDAILRDTFKRYPGADPERRFPCPCSPGCPRSFLFETVLKRFQDGKQYVTCDSSGEDVAIQSLLTGFPKPDSAPGRLAFESEVRRLFTEQLRSQRERMEKTCPSVFTLVPSRDFKQLDTWVDSLTQTEELELALYCEHESGWHPTSHSLYRFRPNQEWFNQVKKHWDAFVRVTKHVGPLTKSIGKAAQLHWVEAVGLGIEKLPGASFPPTGKLSSALGIRTEGEFIDLEARFLLERLIDHLDAERFPVEPKNGGLHAYLVDDGRLLWLCPDHLKLYRVLE